MSALAAPKPGGTGESAEEQRIQLDDILGEPVKDRQGRDITFHMYQDTSHGLKLATSGIVVSDPNAWYKTFNGYVAEARVHGLLVAIQSEAQYNNRLHGRGGSLNLYGQLAADTFSDGGRVVITAMDPRFQPRPDVRIAGKDYKGAMVALKSLAALALGVVPPQEFQQYELTLSRTRLQPTSR